MNLYGLNVNEPTAVLIDGYNTLSTTKLLKFDIDFRKLLNLFQNKTRLVKIYYFASLRDNPADHDPMIPVIQWMMYNGYNVISKKMNEFMNIDNIQSKGNMDVEISVTVLEMVKSVDHIVLFTGDENFRFLIEAVQRMGTRITVCSSMQCQPQIMSDDLRRQADNFIELNNLKSEIQRNRSL